jgi:hypothetical protein
LNPRECARFRAEAEQTVGHHQQVPVPFGTAFLLDLTVSEAEVLFRVLEERLNPPPHRERLNQVLGRRVDLVRD